MSKISPGPQSMGYKLINKFKCLFLTLLIGLIMISPIYCILGDKLYWLGGYAHNTGGTLEWYWYNHQKIGPFQPWSPGQPDSIYETYLETNAGGWNNIGPSSKRSLMCEKTF